MKPTGKKILRYLALTIGIIVLIAIVAVGWFYLQLRASLPQLDGSAALPGAAATVKVTRDAIGVPTIRGRTRADVARALGFLHAQERFFQMDLLRRRATGELAEVFGQAALPLDKATRAHGFRALASLVYARLAPDERTLLESYTAGVNAGLAGLRRPPYEYLVLRTHPVPWRAEDCMLVIYAMTLDLQDANNNYERYLATLRSELGTSALAFFAPLLTPNDAALDGTTAPLAPIPSAREIDLRQQRPLHASIARQTSVPYATTTAPDPDFLPGSNSFAISGAHTTTGAALLANDPHLGLAVPNIWYRAAMEWSYPAPRQIVGVTLPGLPCLVLGSNGRVAWGLTVSYVDTADLITIDINRVDHSLYKIPGRTDLLEIEKRRDTIRVKGTEPVAVENLWTAWGPVIGYDDKERPIVCHWSAHDPAATNFNFHELEDARTAAEAVEIAHRSGMPAHNFVVADSAGTIAWTIVGTVPKRLGFDGRLPVSWTYGDRHWDGFLPPDDVPTIIAPPSGRLWTANNRLVGGAALALLGDGGYANPPRAAQIRDDLDKLLARPSTRVAPQDLAAIQLDDRALFLEPWQKLLLATLTPEITAQKNSRAELRRLVAQWTGRATTDSVSYRLVRAFRLQVAELAFNPIFESCTEALPGFDWRRFHYDEPLWQMLQAKPAHLLNPAYATWDALLVAAADAVVADLDKQSILLARATWGQRNTAHIVHPFGRVLPAWLTGWLNMPADQLPGDSNMPRIQTPTFGASMRLVVSPGREAEGLFQMPGGESGHPLSPYYRAGHAAWVKGEPGPLLPGPTAHTLVLQP